MSDFQSKPSDKLIKDYYAVLGQYGQLRVEHETAVRSAFQAVLRGYSKRLEWTLVPEFAIQKDRHRIVVDGALLDYWTQKRGFWEAKDEHDDLEREIKLKLEKGYPRTNIIFQAPERAILYQNGVRQGLNEDITDAKNLAELLNHFFNWREPHHEEWEAAVAEFKERIPELAERAQHLIEGEKKGNRAFRDSFGSFYELCRQAINPNLSEEAVEKMLIQHLLTERIFRRVFHAEEFRSRNVIACEIEKVIQSLTSRHFSRDQFLSELDRFYKAIERAADEHEQYSDKQKFLNTVYERFFQGFSRKEADTHGIVYTPQPIVDFMVRSVEDILKKEFGKSLADKGVHILDPFVGTGNFITRVMRQIGETHRSALPHKYEHELHCNEIMLLPYYIASMNIEHEYMEQTGEYKPFEGICLVDTFELAEPEQALLAFMTEENTARVKKQKEAPIFVVIGNPPYNSAQANANDDNQNRKYPVVDKAISLTYGKDSSAQLLNKLNDPFVKAIKWASDRIGDEGVVALITNNSFIDQIAFDGMRRNLLRDFSDLYVLDLGGNVRKNPKLSGTTHNVFGIQIGVSINLLIRKRGHAGDGTLHYFALGEDWKREARLDFLESAVSTKGIPWKELHLRASDIWLSEGLQDEFESFVPIGLKSAKDQDDAALSAIFSFFSNGVLTARDEWVYSFRADSVEENVRRLIENFNSESGCYRTGKKLNADETFIKWTDRLQEALESGRTLSFILSSVRTAYFRPFTRKFLYFDPLLNQRRYQQHKLFPMESSGSENLAIWLKVEGEWRMFPMVVDRLCDYMPQGGSQCFPFYTYDEDGTNRRENITDWALEEFRRHYNDESISKWDIFHYTYGVLHSPEYRERYVANLKRELPRIPFAGGGTAGPSTPLRSARDDGGVFWQFVEAGRRLAELHVHYEQQPEYPLERMENPKEKLSFRVEKMRLGKDKASLAYNSFLTLKGIPPETYEYRLGNRSALEWVIDQYQVSTDKRSGITNDPNRDEDPEYILRLIGQVIHVSLETVKIVKALPGLGVEASAVGASQEI